MNSSDAHASPPETVAATSPPNQIGKEPTSVTGASSATACCSTATTAVTELQVWDLLRTCYDPEIPINIVDLGLIYDVAVLGSRVNVKMTLTAPGCPMGRHIASEVQDKLLSLEGVAEANVELVWDPPWHQSMISAEGRLALGWE
jgi:metal-sulfur cluster biosynthetic enzyme